MRVKLFMTAAAAIRIGLICSWAHHKALMILFYAFAGKINLMNF